MIISKEILECAATIEKEHGSPMTTEALRMAELLHRIAADLERIGRKDAERGQTTIVRKEVEETMSCFQEESMIAKLTDILYGAYIEGYAQT